MPRSQTQGSRRGARPSVLSKRWHRRARACRRTRARHAWDDEYYATTDDERDDAQYVLFDDDDGDSIIGDDDDTPQHEGETSDEYEARLNVNDAIPPTAHFCCRPVFS